METINLAPREMLFSQWGLIASTGAIVLGIVLMVLLDRFHRPISPGGFTSLAGGIGLFVFFLVFLFQAEDDVRARQEAALEAKYSLHDTLVRSEDYGDLFMFTATTYGGEEVVGFLLPAGHDRFLVIFGDTD